MRKQIAAANWKMNLTLAQAEMLVKDVLASQLDLKENQEAVFGIPFPYLVQMQNLIAGRPHIFTAAQNCSHKVSGAYTGEISVEMLKSIGVPYVIIGHSERREYFKETNIELSEKVEMCFDYGFGPFRWVCTSGDSADLATTDRIAAEAIRDMLASCPDEIKSQWADNLHWIETAATNIPRAAA